MSHNPKSITFSLMKIASSNTIDLINWLQNLQEFQLDSIFETTILGRAYDYITKVVVVSSENNVVSCQLVGTTLYDIKIEKVGDNINGHCNCPHDQKCKHMAAVILSLMNIDWGKI